MSIRARFYLKDLIMYLFLRGVVETVIFYLYLKIFIKIFVNGRVLKSEGNHKGFFLIVKFKGFVFVLHKLVSCEISM